MKVSIIIPTYNRADVIVRSLATWSVQDIAQESYEVIIVDNNSTDESPELIQEYIEDKPNFRYLKETQAGSTYARHSGARIARGEILIFSDDDGLFNPGCVQAVLDVYARNTDVAAVAGKIEVQWDKKAPEWIEPYLFMLGRLNYGKEVIYRKDIYLNGGIFSIRKEVFEELGGFNPDLIGNYLVGDGDTGLVIKLHEAGKLIGWTPYAEMKHLQFADKQGTVKDMGRRFYNTGISNTYGFYRKQGFRFRFATIVSILRSLLFYCKKKAEYLLKKDMKVYFSMMQKKGELAFWTNLRYAEIRKEVKKMDCYHL